MQVRRNRGIAELGLFKSFGSMRSSLCFGVSLLLGTGFYTVESVVYQYVLTLYIPPLEDNPSISRKHGHNHGRNSMPRLPKGPQRLCWVACLLPQPPVRHRDRNQSSLGWCCHWWYWSCRNRWTRKCSVGLLLSVLAIPGHPGRAVVLGTFHRLPKSCGRSCRLEWRRRSWLALRSRTPRQSSTLGCSL